MTISLNQKVELQYQGMVGTEANILSSFKNKFSLFASNTLAVATSSLDSVMTFSEPDKGKAVTEKLADVSYSALSGIIIPVPFGLKGSLSDLVGTLDKHSQFSITIADDLLMPVRRYIGTLINDPDQLKSIVNVKSIRAVKLRDYDKVVNDLNSHFKGNNSEAKFGNVFGNKAQLMECKDVVSAISEKLDRSKVKMIQDELGKLEVRANALADIIDEADVSKATAQALSEFLYHVAKECETFTYYMSRLYSTEEAFKHIDDKLQKIKG